MSDRMVKDPVCGKDVDTLRARAVGIFGGVTYYFCSADCKTRFNDPRKEPRPAAAPQREPERPQKPTRPAPISMAPAGGEPEARPKAEGKPDEEVKYARSRPKREPEPESDRHLKADPSPSVEAEVEAIKRSGARPWLLVLLLFSIAGVVLFYAFRK